MNRLLLTLLIVCVSACSTVSEKQRIAAQSFVSTSQSQKIECVPNFPCGIDSPFQQQAKLNFAQSSSSNPKHTLILPLLTSNGIALYCLAISIEI